MHFKLLSCAATFFLLANAASAQTVLPSEPPPGQLAAGQVVLVACGPGKARKVTGGSHMKGGADTGSGSKRQRGPCLAVKN